MIEVGLHSGPENTVALTAKGNCIGLPSDIDHENPKNVGFQWVETLARQLGGTVTCETLDGAHVTVSFQLTEEKEHRASFASLRKSQPVTPTEAMLAPRDSIT